MPAPLLLCCSSFCLSLTRCTSLLKKSPPHWPRQEIILPEPVAEVQRDTLNGKAGEPAVSQLPDAPVPQSSFPLSPGRWYSSVRGGKQSPGYCERQRSRLASPLAVWQCDDIVQRDNSASGERLNERPERADIVTRDCLCAFSPIIA